MPGPAEFIHGDILIGAMVNIFLYGIMIVQVYIYYTTYKRDHMFIKLFVFALLLADAVNTVFLITFMYMSLIRNFGDPEYLTKINWTPVSTGLITLMVQLFYAWKIRVLTRNWFLVVIIGLLSVTSAVFAWVTSWEMLVVFPQWNLLQGAKVAVSVWLTCAVAADIVITIILRNHRSGFQQTDMMINRIIRITMQTCLLTTMVAILELGFYLCIPSGTYVVFMLILSKLYSNSLVSSLNSRGGWQYNTAATPECESNFIAHGVSNPTQVDFSISPPSTGLKPQTYLDSTSTGTEVFVHVESHGTQDVALHGKDIKA